MSSKPELLTVSGVQMCEFVDGIQQFVKQIFNCGLPKLEYLTGYEQ